jgi:hypothetical protein
MFGYLDQLDGYLVGSASDNLVRVKDRAYILAVDKTLGHICLYEHRIRELSIHERISAYKRVVGLDEPPACRCGWVEDGESGNLKLDVKASYSSFKHSCAENRGVKLRTFIYAGGPRYLTKVVRRPTWKGMPIKEVDKHGKIVYT